MFVLLKHTNMSLTAELKYTNMSLTAEKFFEMKIAFSMTPDYHYSYAIFAECWHNQNSCNKIPFLPNPLIQQQKQKKKYFMLQVRMIHMKRLVDISHKLQK